MSIIVAGNFIDFLEFEMALQQFLKALDIAKDIKVDHLIGMSHMNIGICYEELRITIMLLIIWIYPLKFLENLNTSF